MSKDDIKILIIEDEELLIQAIMRKLERVGLHADVAKLGEEALDYLNKCKKLPDVIWLDYYLPDMSGIDFMKKIRENDKYNDVLVVVVSNSANDQNVATIMAMGVKKYIIKAEHTLDDIIETIQRLVNNN